MAESIIIQILDSWSKRYFFDPILLLSEILSLLICLKYYRKTLLHTVFIGCITVYLSGYILIQIVSINTFISSPLHRKIIRLSVNNVIILAEFFTYYFFFKKALTSRLIKKILLLPGALILTTITIIQYFTIINQTTYYDEFSFFVNAFEFFILLATSLRYFFELTKQALNLWPTKSPSFIISSGLLIYISVSLPFMCIGNYFLTVNKNIHLLLSLIHYLSLIILLISISKAFKLKKNLEE